MIFLFPISHESQIIRRIPYITISIISICFLLQIYSTFQIKKDKEHLQFALNNLRDYYSAHSNKLTFPDVFSQFISSQEWAKEHPSSELTTKEELEFNRLILEFLTIRENTLYYKYGYIPGRWDFTIITSIFFHGGWLHLIFNMWFLWLAATVIEDLWGRIPFLIFYIFSGVVASLTHHLVFSELKQPLIGASGAIAGIMGAFLVKFFNTKINMFYLYFITFYPRHGTFQARAYIMLILWLLQQFLYAFLDPRGELGIGFWAHIGGFLFGSSAAFLLKKSSIEQTYLLSKTEAATSFYQNPLFSEALKLYDSANYQEAQAKLELLLSTDPNHIEAQMLMFQIANKKLDTAIATKYLSLVIENYIKKNEISAAADLYREYQSQYFPAELSSPSVLKLATYLKNNDELDMALTLLYKTFQQHSDELIGYKALNLYAEFNENKRNYQESLNALSILLQKDLPSEFRFYIENKFEQIKKEISASELYSKKTLNIQEIKILHLEKDGLTCNISGAEELLRWNSIRFLSIARIKNITMEKPLNDYLVIDLIASKKETEKLMIFRTYSYKLKISDLILEPEKTTMEKFIKFIEIIQIKSKCNSIGCENLMERRIMAFDNIEEYNDYLLNNIKR